MAFDIGYGEVKMTDADVVRAVPRHNSLEDHYQRMQQEKKQEAAQQAYQQQVGGVLKAHDPVNSPSHYTSGGIETIDFIEAKQLNFNLGNAVKYITRCGKKSWVSDSKAQDLEKAVWYLQREIKNLKKA